jgi:hypothetical protein
MSNIFEGLLSDHLGKNFVEAYRKDKPKSKVERIKHCVEFVNAVLMMLGVSGQCYLLLASWCAAEVGDILNGETLNIELDLHPDIKSIVLAWLS